MEPSVLVHEEEAGDDGGAGHGGQLPGPPRKAHLPPEEGHGQAVQAEVPVPLHAHQRALAQEGHQGQGGEPGATHRDAHHPALVAEPLPEPLHGFEAVRLVHRVDAEAPLPEEDAAQLVVAGMGREQDDPAALGEGPVQVLDALQARELRQGLRRGALAKKEEVHPGAGVLAHHLPGGVGHGRVLQGPAQDLGCVAEDGLQVAGPEQHEGIGDAVGGVVAALPTGEGSGEHQEQRKERPKHGRIEEAEELAIGLHAVLHGRS